MNQNTKMVVVNRNVFLGLKALQEKTLATLGEVVGLDASNMCRLAKGHRYIERKKAERLSEVLKVPVEVIFQEVK
ncbi:hypothetical protein MYX82_03745 [Acidobacteria bacterium AH-259-D05]|nr:hypothetical protein [Acidobacteria bacterium AH-259-D05]